MKSELNWNFLRIPAVALVVGTGLAALHTVPAWAQGGTGDWDMCCDQQPQGINSCTGYPQIGGCTTQSDCAHWFSADNSCCMFYFPCGS